MYVCGRTRTLSPSDLVVLTPVCVVDCAASKDKFPTAWWAETGERIGTYNGHTGAVWHLDVDYASEYLLTAAADMTARLWRVVMSAAAVSRYSLA